MCASASQLFVNDQHDATQLPQLWWRETFKRGISSIGHSARLPHRPTTARTPTNAISVAPTADR